MFKIFRPVLFLAVLVLPLTGFAISTSNQEEIHAIDSVVYNDVDAGIKTVRSRWLSISRNAPFDFTLKIFSRNLA